MPPAAVDIMLMRNIWIIDTLIPYDMKIIFMLRATMNQINIVIGIIIIVFLFVSMLFHVSFEVFASIVVYLIPFFIMLIFAIFRLLSVLVILVIGIFRNMIVRMINIASILAGSSDDVLVDCWNIARPMVEIISIELTSRPYSNAVMAAPVDLLMPHCLFNRSAFTGRYTLLGVI